MGRVMRTGAWSKATVVMGLVACAIVGSCSDPGGVEECTLIGCVNGLWVKFDQTPPPGTVVTLVLGSTPWRVTCGADANCSQGIFFSGLRVDYVLIRVTIGGNSTDYERRPEYVETTPNGPTCEPTCFNAVVLVAVPVEGA